jgi:tRNA-(ms[2]io[6]A)-hydroxylase
MRLSLPLKYHTPDTWAHGVLKDPLALLSDHAYLEKKAATNVLDLLNRWPERMKAVTPAKAGVQALSHFQNKVYNLDPGLRRDDNIPDISKSVENWTATLSAIAKDETIHLQAVIRLIRKRGGQLQRLHRSQYASDLRLLVRRGLVPYETLDRLLVSALIEARSCERFEILSRMAKDKELGNFYKGLCASEKGHFKIFLNLAKQVVSTHELKERWNEMLEAEATIIQSQSPGACLHSGLDNKNN